MAKKRSSIAQIPVAAVPEPVAPQKLAFEVSPKAQKWLFLAGLVILSIVVFWKVVPPGRILFTTDDNIGAMMTRKSLLPYGFYGIWDNTSLVGSTGMVQLTLTNILLYLLPIRIFTNWMHAIDLVLASTFLMLFLRLRGLSLAACAVSALTAFWLGSTFTLTYAGHIGKFGVIVFAAMALWLIEKSAQKRSVAWSILAGGAVGGLFLEQADIGLFFALPLGAYAITTLLRSFGGPKHARLWILLVVMGASALFMSYRPLLGGYQTAKDNTVSGGDTAEGRWNYATQWSWPPEESIDFIAMGYMGWRSGEASGPYWGRMGRSADYEKTQQGMRNFKLENQYLGIVPVALGTWALLCGCLWMRRQQSPWRGDMIFWSAATVLTFLLSIGKFFFLYRLFYHLPMVSAIRNPNKFLQVFQLALGVLAAYGFDLAFTRSPATQSLDSGPSMRRFSRSALVLAGVMLLALLISAGGSSSAVRELTSAGWGNAATIISQNKIQALLQGTIMTSCFAALLWFVARRKDAATIRPWVTWLPILLIVLDVVILSRHYVSTMPPSYVEENEIVKILKQERASQGRATLVVQDGFYNNWLTFLFPYHNLEFFNTMWSRLPAEYTQIMQKLRAVPDRLWQLAAVQDLLAPAQILNEFNRSPDFKDAFELIYAYNVAGTPNGEMLVLRASQERPGQHVILRSKKPAPRFALIGKWAAADDDEALDRLASRDYTLFDQVLVTRDDMGGLAAPGDAGLAGTVDVESRQPHKISLRVSANRNAILRISEKYDPGWQATVDGQPAKVLRCDYLFQGVPLNAGLHTVELKFAPKDVSLLVQSCAIALCLACAAFVALPRKTAAPAS